ncbi:MAG: cation:proton antiporter [Candidatus Acidiferrales bacterium]
MDPVARVVVEIAGILLLGALGEFIFARTRVPDVVWLVSAGILAGPVFGLIPSGLLRPGIPFFGAIALTVILSSGAFRLQLTEVAAAAPRGILLGLSGFVFSVIAICGFFWLSTKLGYVRPAPPLAWVMVGAIVGGTSSVVIMPTMAMAQAPSRVARILEVESSATDALSVIVTMVLIDLIVSGSADVSRPFIFLARELGVGVALGMIAAALLVPGIPSMRDKPHGYTVFLASMLALYGITDFFKGNGAMAVLVASLLIGNASSIVPRLFPGAHGLEFTPTQTTRVMQDQMAFLIKSFFFFLIGLMFPTNLRQIALAAIGVLFLMAMRVPAVLLSTRNMRLGKKEFCFLSAAIPRGLAAGVLATLPMQYGVPGVENLAPAIFAVIVLSVLVFAIGFAIVARLPDDPALIRDVHEAQAPR